MTSAPPSIGSWTYGCQARLWAVASSDDPATNSGFLSHPARLCRRFGTPFLSSTWRAIRSTAQTTPLIVEGLDPPAPFVEVQVDWPLNRRRRSAIPVASPQGKREASSTNPPVLRTSWMAAICFSSGTPATGWDSESGRQPGWGDHTHAPSACEPVSPPDVQNDARGEPLAITVTGLAEERRGIGVRGDPEEPIVAADTPSARRRMTS